MVNKFIKSNLYGVDGLSDDIFYLGITNAFLTPILKIVDPNYFFSLASKWYSNRPYSKIYFNQS
jgi:hypothetical protein